MPEEIIVESWREKIARSLALTRLQEAELDLARGVLVGDVEDDQPALLELVGDRLLGLGLDLAAGLAAGEVDRLEDVGAHVVVPRPPPATVRPSRRLSSSGVDERASASFWVILPWRTSVASEASIVCMPGRRAGLQHRVDLVGLALADQVADRRVGHEHLARHHAAGAVGGRQQLLGHDALQRDRQLHAHLALLVGGEHVDDAVDRLGGVLGVQGREHEVAGLGRGQGRGDRLEVAHLADEDHVGVLAQGGLQGVARSSARRSRARAG